MNISKTKGLFCNYWKRFLQNLYFLLEWQHSDKLNSEYGLLVWLPCQPTFVPDLKFHPHCCCYHFHDVSSFFLWSQNNVLVSIRGNWAQANKPWDLEKFEQKVMLLDNSTSQWPHYWVCGIAVFFHRVFYWPSGEQIPQISLCIENFC